MGYYTSAWLAYGMQIPDTSSDVLQEALAPLMTRAKGDDHVGYLHAGRYDNEDTFLVTRCTEAELGDPVVVAPERVTAEQYAEWKASLVEACRALGLAEVPPAEWLLIAHVS
ncbi:hypothetical protein [Streptomyces sp. NPDC002088]|uniref:hypothetical protein n=1 Tax=Streptomyces sp. NPDC002088 TaxID=3154665 RepID=UPI00332C312A